MTAMQEPPQPSGNLVVYEWWRPQLFARSICVRASGNEHPAVRRPISEICELSMAISAYPHPSTLEMLISPSFANWNLLAITSHDIVLSWRMLVSWTL